LQRGFRHDNTFKRGNGKLVILALALGEENLGKKNRVVLQFEFVLKGRDFSRAEKAAIS
jgi:hypothetical protein